MSGYSKKINIKPLNGEVLDVRYHKVFGKGFVLKFTRRGTAYILFQSTGKILQIKLLYLFQEELS